MKKFISIFTSIIMTIAVICTGSISAFAESTTKYWEPKPNCQDITPCVNDVEFGGIIDSSYDPSTTEHLFTYKGEGIVTDWEFPLSQEGKDYKIISQTSNSITIKLINENHVLPYINALVDFGKETASTSSDTTQSNTTVWENTSTTETTKQSTSVTAKKTATDINNENFDNNKIIVPYAVIGVIIVITVIGIILIKKQRA